MKHLTKGAATLFCVAAFTTILSTGARAQDIYNKITTVTFSAPVEIPGTHLKGYATLPAGTYVFKLMDSNANRHIVQIFTADQSKCLATILAIPNQRIKRSDKTVITFRERPNGEPPALRAWFYPTATFGDEFVYGKKRAKELATATETPVLYNNADTEETAEVTEPIQPPAPAEVAQMNQTDVRSYSQAGEEQDLNAAVDLPAPPAEMAQNVPPPMPAAAPAPEPVASPTPAELPQTASPLGWIMLSGLLSLFGGLGLKLIRQNV